ncbi:hypothetical protein GCM10022252_44240 [Streptosporangium oxazolinicum]|uniref:Uncharacterized protein n=2 Tax=Streptosporangium oxazolinicum TaxID=909287 RepID=A0ABP8B2P0_9ACTN
MVASGSSAKQGIFIQGRRLDFWTNESAGQDGPDRKLGLSRIAGKPYGKIEAGLPPQAAPASRHLTFARLVATGGSDFLAVGDDPAVFRSRIKAVPNRG